MNQFDIVLDFISYFAHKNRVLEMTTGHATVSVKNLIQMKDKQKIKIKGGSPKAELNIDDKDIRAERKGMGKLLKII